MVSHTPVKWSRLSVGLFLSVGGGVMAAACGTTTHTPGADQPTDSESSDASATSSGSGSAGSRSGSAGGASGGGAGGASGGTGSTTGVFTASDAGMSGASMTLDPQTCAQAAQAHSYIGCDYWPTVLANTVWDIFDFAVVVANAGQSSANVSITGPSGTNQTATVAPGQLVKMYLPWVPALKGPGADACGDSPPVSSVLQAGGAFHLVSTAPVSVYQFNA